MPACSGTTLGGNSAHVLFPLPFSPFEYYYWTDDRVDYPTAYPVDLTFAGRFDRAAFQAALAQAIARHPLVGARVDDSGPLPCWIAGPAEPPGIDWADASEPLANPSGTFIDLRRESGLRIWVRESPQTSRVYMQFHHACCDGVGMFQFVDDWLACYASAVDGSAPQLPTLDVERLRQRDRLAPDDAPPPSLAAGLRDLSVLAMVWGDILLSRSARLAPSTTEPSDRRQPPAPFLDFKTHKFSVSETTAIREAARSLGTTTNDLLTRDVLVVMHAWNQRHENARRGRLRLNVPINVREPSDATMPATNRIGFAFVDPPRHLYRDAGKLLHAVQAQMQRAKEWKLGLYFLGGLTFAANHPRLAAWALKRNGSFATAVFSNLGRVFAAADWPAATVGWSVATSCSSGSPACRRSAR